MPLPLLPSPPLRLWRRAGTSPGPISCSHLHQLLVARIILVLFFSLGAGGGRGSAGMGPRFTLPAAPSASQLGLAPAERGFLSGRHAGTLLCLHSSREPDSCLFALRSWRPRGKSCSSPRYGGSSFRSGRTPLQVSDSHLASGHGNPCLTAQSGDRFM